MDASKLILGICLTIFGAIGGYMPVLFGDNDPLGGWAILGSTIGGFIGIWVWYRLRSYIG